MKPKIVFVINYFYPDYASTGQLLTELCLYLRKDFDITVIAQQPNYAGETIQETKRITYDKLEDIKVIRIKLPAVNKNNKLSRLKYILTYFLCALYLTIKQNNVRMIYTISQPPILGGLIGTVAKWLKRSKHVYNIQDFNPEQAEAISYTKQQWIFNVARSIDQMNCRVADHIIVVGRDMQQTLIKRFGNKKITPNTVINNWTNEQDIVPLSKEHPEVQKFLEENNLSGKFIVMYSGNIGLYYDLENIIKVTKQFDDDHIAFVFIGEGAVKQEMQEYVQQHDITNCFFLPYQPLERLKYSLNAADVHLVVNQKGIKGVSVPSKIYGVMAAGKAVLGVLESGSEADQLIKDSQCGVVVEPQDYDRLVDQLRFLYTLDPKELEEYGLQGRNYLEQYLTKERSLQKYKELLQSLC